MSRLPVKIEPERSESGAYLLKMEWVGEHPKTVRIPLDGDLLTAHVKSSALYRLMWRLYEHGRVPENL